MPAGSGLAVGVDVSASGVFVPVGVGVGVAEGSGVSVGVLTGTVSEGVGGVRAVWVDSYWMLANWVWSAANWVWVALASLDEDENGLPKIE